MIVSDLSAQVNDLLRPMGITRNVSAYSILLRCIELIYEQDEPPAGCGERDLHSDRRSAMLRP